MNEELEKIEIKCAYLEEQVAVLNEVVIEQQKSIDSLLIQLQKMKRKVDELAEDAGEARENRRPPHY